MPTTAELQGRTYKRGEKVRLLDDIPGYPAGSIGKIGVANGMTWKRYWVRFPDGNAVGHVDHGLLVRAKDYDQFLVARDREAIEAEKAAELAAEQAAANAATLKNLSGGQAGACNYESEDRFSSARKHAHQAVMWGFLLCFASTASGTAMHYLLDWPAPYGVLTPPKLLGLPGGVLMTVGAVYLAILKRRADPALGADAVAGETAFIYLLGAVGATGMALYAATGTALVPVLLAIHLGCVLAFFLITPYSKMAHGAYRFAALVREAQLRR